MNTKESAFWKILRQHTKHAVMWQRIETGHISRGVPDAVGASKLKGSVAFIELKMIRGKKVRFQPEQPVWLARWPGRCWVVARKITASYDQLMVWDGKKALDLARGDIESVPPDLMFRRRGDWDWSQLVDFLFH